MFLNFAARLDPRASVDDLVRDLRSIDSRFALDVQPVDATYAAAHKERLLAARTVGVFAALSFFVAIAGLYGVMAFLVANRRREMGIRLALGATQHQVRSLVLASATRLVITGGAIGIAAAVLSARGLRSQLYGVNAIDSLTYVAVGITFILAAIAATWLPARQASRSDPSTILRQD